MSGSSTSYHEPVEQLSARTRNMHRALVSLQEELEAVDWYQQRADATDDAELKAILLHNMQEEIEHACMVIEWLRRNSSGFDEQLRTYVFTEQSVVDVEEEAEGGGGGSRPAARSRAAASTKFTIGDLKGKGRR